MNLAILYPPSTVLLGFLAGFEILAVAGFITWRAVGAGLQQKLRTLLIAIGFVAAGLTMLGTTAHLAVVQLNTSKVSVAAVSLNFVVVLALAAVVIATVVKRMAIGAAGAAFLLAMSLATFMELGQFWAIGNLDGTDAVRSWTFGLTIAWALVGITGLALVVTVSVKLIQAYGHKQFQLGQQAALDASQQQDKMSLNS